MVMKRINTDSKKQTKKQTKKPGDVLFIHIFSHTHWDFEWYEVQEGFKMQLVHLIDHLLDTLERDPDFKFHFDGQVMPIMDYLEILKEQDDLDNKDRVGDAERKISNYIKRGQLFIGPCWTTPETSIISTESLIRNINRGIRFSKKFGGASSVFYNADAFQYHSQVPQIIKGTGLKSAFTWRSFKEGKALKDLTMWEGADKTTVMKYHPARTYAQVWHLPEDINDTVNVIKEEAEHLKHFAATSHVLITQGNDQFEAQSDLIDTLRKADEIIGEKYRIDQISLEDFFENNRNAKLSVLHGELTGNKWACTMSGQLSTRMYLKQTNKKAEIALEKWAEPFATFAWFVGGEYPAGLMERAWEYLMKQHFHHCNACAADEVHREGEVRYNSAIELARDITDESLRNIASKINSSDIIHKWENALVVFNPSGTERTEVVKVEINAGMPTREDADWQSDKERSKQAPEAAAELILWDEKGERLPFQVVAENENIYEIAFWADRIPQFGYKTFGLSFSGGREFPGTGNIADEKENVLENEIIKVTIHEDGTFAIYDKRNGARFNNLNILENTADHGDSYNYDPLKGDKAITTKGVKGRIVLKENGPFLATYEVNTALIMPDCLSTDRKIRIRKLIRMPILFRITLKKDSPLVHITVQIDNRARDHRLRALFPGVKSDVVYVQTQGDVVKRRIKRFKKYPESKKRNITHHTSVGKLPKEAGPSTTQFQRNFVGICEGEKGLGILNKGLPEYEAKADGTIALTLLRSIGWLSQDDLSSRDRLAGPKMFVRDAQCLGEYTFEYAVLPLSGPWEAMPVYHQQNRYNVPVKCLQIPWQDERLPTRLDFVRISPEGLIVSAVKKAYSNNDAIIRLVNPTSKSLKGRLEILIGIKDAWLADLNEEKIDEITTRNGSEIYLTVEAKKIITIRIAPERYDGTYM